jgi:hypothetical protein
MRTDGKGRPRKIFADQSLKNTSFSLVPTLSFSFFVYRIFIGNMQERCVTGILIVFFYQIPGGLCVPGFDKVGLWKSCESEKICFEKYYPR